MARTESKSVQVHPNDEQRTIDLMQEFHWNLQSSQEIKVKESHLAKGEHLFGEDTLDSVTTTEHYIKLVFSRDLDLPNLNGIKELEQQYFSLPYPAYPKLFPVSIWLWIVGSFIYGIGIVGWLAYFFLSYNPKKNAADTLVEQNRKKRLEIMDELEKHN